MSTDANLRAYREDIIRRHMADENTQNFEDVLTEFAHPRYEIIPTGEIYDGWEAVSSYYQKTRSTFPDQRNEIIQLRHTDDAVIVEFWLRGTMLGPLGDIPPTGKQFECRMAAFFLFEGKRLVCERVYFDGLTMLQQLTGKAI